MHGTRFLANHLFYGTRFGAFDCLSGVSTARFHLYMDVGVDFDTAHDGPTMLTTHAVLYAFSALLSLDP